MTEKQLQSQIIEAIHYSGLAYVFNVNAGKIKIETKKGTRMFQGAPTGHSDIQGIRKKDGKFIALEVKKPKRRKYTTEAQEMFLEEIKNYNGIAAVVTSPEEALDAIKNL